jgi:Family of unknown function (DUF6220)
MATRADATIETPARPGLVTALRITAPLIPTLALIQAFFAGRGLFIDTDQIDIHGMLGNLTFLLVLVQAGLVLFAGFRGRSRAALLGMSLALVVLVAVQLALGYSGRDGGEPAAWHVPNGVLIFGMSVGIAATLSRFTAAARAEAGG